MVILNSLMNRNYKKFKDHLHNFFNKSNVMYINCQPKCFCIGLQQARKLKLQWLSAYLVTRSLSNEVWDKVNFRFNTTPPHLNGTGSIRKWNFKIMHQTIPCGRDSTLFRVLLVWVHTNFLKNYINYTVHASMSSIHI